MVILKSKVLVNFISAETLSTWDWRPKDEMKEGRQAPASIQVENSLMEVLSCKFLLPFKEKEVQVWGQNHKEREQSHEPQGTIPRPGKLMFLLLARFWNCLGLGTPFSFPFSPILNRSVYNRHPMPVPPLRIDNLFSSFTDPEMERPRTGLVQSLTHTWYRWQNSRL